MNVKSLRIMVCSSCDNTCNSCSHLAMRNNNIQYHLSLESLSKFIKCTEESGYVFSTVVIDGDGEPLLWKNLNSGIEQLYKSKSFQQIIITTNGNRLNNIKGETWEYIDTLEVSVYPNFKNRDTLDRLRLRYPLKIEVNSIDFFQKPKHDYPYPIPCICVCPGPTLYDNKIYLYCGPNVFDALKYSDIPEENISTEIALNYLKDYDSKSVGNLEYCRYCLANNEGTFSLTPVGQYDR